MKKFPSLNLSKIPSKYCLGKGHILFFKNKLSYLRKRHELLKKEMSMCGFKPTKTVSLSKFPQNLCKNFTPTELDKKIIKKRLMEKLKKKPTYYTYYGKHKPLSFLVELIEEQK